MNKSRKQSWVVAVQRTCNETTPSKTDYAAVSALQLYNFIMVLRKGTSSSESSVPLWLSSDTIWQVVLLPSWLHQAVLWVSIFVEKEHLMMVWNPFSDMTCEVLTLCQQSGFETQNIAERHVFFWRCSIFPSTHFKLPKPDNQGTFGE